MVSRAWRRVLLNVKMHVSLDIKAANLHKKLTLAPNYEYLPGPFRFPIVHWRATSRLLYFAHILSAGDHVGAGSDASHGGRISDALWCWPRWYVRGTQGMGGSLLQLDHQTGMKYFCNLSSSWQPPETFYLIHKRCQKYPTQSLMRVRKKGFLGLIVTYSSSLIA